LGSGDSIVELNKKVEKYVSRKDTIYPFGIHQPISNEANNPKLRCDNGINVEGNQNEIPSTPVCRRARRRRGSTHEKASEASFDSSTGNSTINAKNLTDTEFEVLTDDLNPIEAQKLLSLDDKFKYGNADPLIPSSNVPCSGCGALLHCQDSKFPGFLPVELFSNAQTESELRELWCQRCYIMKKYDIALKVSVSPQDYPKTISHLKNKKAIIVLVVDLTDFPGSVWPDIINELGPNKRIILVGNKIDLLPADSKRYLKTIENAMVQTFKDKCAMYFESPSLESNHEEPVQKFIALFLYQQGRGIMWRF